MTGEPLTAEPITAVLKKHESGVRDADPMRRHGFNENTLGRRNSK